MSMIYEPHGKAREYSGLACSIYLRCTMSCQYCYCPQALKVSREQYHTKPEPRPNFLKQLSNDARKLEGAKEPVLLSFIGDCYQPANDEYNLTREAIKILQANGLKVIILTKGGRRAMRDFDILRPGLDQFATTLTFYKAQDSLEWEPGAALPHERLKSLMKAHNKGIRTWVSLEPVVYPEQTLCLIKLSHTFVDHYKVGIMNYKEKLPAHLKAKVNGTNWTSFGMAAVDIFRTLGKSYYIKNDLKHYIPKSHWEGGSIYD